jgi:hypothetical protein
LSILFCTPCYGGMMHAAHMRSCTQLKEDLTQVGLRHDWLIGTNESLVHRGRMEMTPTFLATDFDYMMWLDADIEYTSEHVAKLWNLVTDPDRKVEIAVGVYPMKKPGKSWFAAWHEGKLVKNLDQFDGPIEVDFAGTGFMLISRKAIEKVYAHLKVKQEIAKKLRAAMGELTGLRKLVADEMLDALAADYEGAEGKRVPALYTAHTYKDGLESEDYHFCRVAREAGLSVWMDPSVKLAHWGMYAYGQFEYLQFSKDDAPNQAQAVGVDA